MKFDVVHDASNNIYGDDNDIRLINSGPSAFFINYRLKMSPNKHQQNISQAHIVSLMYKIITSLKDSDDLSIRFHRDPNRKKRELT